ncbi:MAG: glycosyltransferase family 2 protein [Chthoniobacterales bacterium]|nr:glycosyltransferase family 2 protein [Chthoniobacterales bacterium]
MNKSARMIGERSDLSGPKAKTGPVYNGHLDCIRGNSLKGWIWRVGDLSPVTVDVLVDGVIAGRIVASEYRGDLRRAGIGGGAHAFRWQVPERYHDNLTHTFELETAEDHWRLPQVLSERLVFGELSLQGSHGVTGWFRESEEIAIEVRLFIDGVLSGKSSLTDRGALGSGMNGNTFEFPFSHRWRDNKEHEIWANVVTSLQSRTLGPIRAKLHRDDDFAMSGQVSGLKRNVIEGQVFGTGPPDGVREIVLLVDGVEEARTRTDVDGRFFLPVVTLSVLEWIHSRVEVVCLPEHAPLRFDGRHIVADTIGIEIRKLADDEYVEGTLHSEFTLADDIEIAAYAGAEQIGALRLSEPAAAVSAEFRLPLTGAHGNTSDLSFAVNGVPVKKLASAPAEVEPTAEPSWRPRTPSSFVPIDDPAVQLRLQELALGNPEKRGDLSAPPISGAWRFVPPDRVEGWAMDMASPNEPLSVTLYVDGLAVESRAARESTQPAESQISFEVPVGFTFILPLLPHSRCELEVRPCGGGSLAPHKPRVIRFDARESASALSAEVLNQTREAIDRYVEAGRLVEGYLLARRHARAASIDARHLVLDFALRTEWHTYSDVLALWNAQRRAGPVLEYLRSEFLTRKGSVPKRECQAFPFRRFGLPPSYAPLLKGEETEGAADDLLKSIEKSLAWRALAAVLDDKRVWPEPERVAILYVLTGADPGAMFFRHLIEAAAQGIALALVIDSEDGHEKSLSRLLAAGVNVSVLGSRDIKAAVSDALAALVERKFLIVSRRPGIYGAGALRLWPSVLAQRRASLTFAEVSHPLDLALAGRAHDFDSTVLREPTRESLLCFLEEGAQDFGGAHDSARVEITAYVPKSRVATKASLIVLHDFESTPQLPVLPVGTMAFRIRGRKVMMSESELSLADFREALKERHGAIDQTPVVFLSRHLLYPRDYLSECLRLSRVHRGEVRISLLPLAYEDRSQAFSVAKSRTPSLSFFALLPACCLFLRDIPSLTEELAGTDRLILRSDQPLLNLPFLSRNEATRHSLQRVFNKFDLSPAARQKGFVGAALAGRANTILTLPNSAVRLVAAEAQEKMATVTRAMAALSNPDANELRVKELKRLLSLGQRDLAERVLLKSIGTAEAIGEATREKIETVLNGAKLLGLEESVNARLRPYAEALVNRLPALVTPLFECLAVTLSEGDFTAALFSCVPALVTGQEGKGAYQLAELCRKYCSPGAFLTLLFSIDSSANNRILSEKQFASLVGDALSAGECVPFTLPSSRLDQEFFLQAAPLERRLMQAVLGGDRESFTKLADRLLSRGCDGFNALLRILRVYSSELSELDVALAEIGHSVLLSAREQLMLAAMLDDKQHIAQRLSRIQVRADDALIVAATCVDNYALLERAYERWGDEAGVMPIRFRGNSISSMFENFAAMDRPDPVNRPTDKVSVIMSVCNPDFDLLKLAIISVLRQTHSNFELLLMDDASDRVDVGRIEQLAAMDERISFFRMPRNQGPYMCRNRALELCAGAYITIQDGDDYSHPERLERQVAALKVSPILQYCTAAHLRIDKNAHLQFEHTLKVRGDGVMSSMFRRSLIDRLGPFAAVRSRGDVEFRERVRSSHGSHAITHIECPLIFCYATPQSLSNQTVRNSIHFLSLFRQSFEVLRRDRVVPWEERAQPRSVAVPWPLRP